MISNFAQECYYLKNKVGVVDFTKAHGVVKFQSTTGKQNHYYSYELLLKHKQCIKRSNCVISHKEIEPKLFSAILILAKHRQKLLNPLNPL